MSLAGIAAAADKRYSFRYQRRERLSKQLARICEGQNELKAGVSLKAYKLSSLPHALWLVESHSGRFLGKATSSDSS